MTPKPHLFLAITLASGTLSLAQSADCPPYCHPHPQPRPPASTQVTEGCTPGSPQCESCPDCLTKVDTGEGIFPAANPFNYKTFPGTNFLPSVYTNNFDGLGLEMVNTLPSTPNIPYNLHDGDPEVSAIDPTSPIDDLRSIIDGVNKQASDVVRLQADKEAEGEDWTPYDQGELEYAQQAVRELIQKAIDILEGNHVPYRAYSGFPLLHYTGPEKVKTVVPIEDEKGVILGGNVDVHQIWYGQHIEADTAFIDPSPLLNLTDAEGKERYIPWTVTYTVDVLNRGHDDFSPFVTYTDNPKASPWANSETGQPCDPGTENCQQKPAMPNVGMDQSFFNMEDGTRTVFKIKMAAPQYLNLVYTWGWRSHPPRIQVMEKAIKKVSYGFVYPDQTKMPRIHPGCPAAYNGLTLPEVEMAVFCQPDSPDSPWWNGTPQAGQDAPPPPQCSSVRCQPGDDPQECRQRQLYAIGRIGDMAPAKRMWQGFGHALQAVGEGNYEQAVKIVDEEVRPAYFAWLDRTHLPCFRYDESGSCLDGINQDPDSDITIIFINNTIYGQLTDGAWVRWDAWKERYNAERPDDPRNDAILNVTAYNGDNYVHAYNVADFGGNRGWENQFKSSVRVAGSGCWFTFGRAYWWMPAGGPNGFLCVPRAGLNSGESTQNGYCAAGGVTLDDGSRVCPSRHRFEVKFNFDPSRRLRFYQFDPIHHDVAIYSIH